MFEGFEEPNNEARSELLNETFERFFTEDYRNSIKERYGEDIKIRKIAITKNKQSHQFGIRISKNKNKPWVTDIESIWQLYIGKKTKKSKEKVREILTNKNCKNYSQPLTLLLRSLRRKKKNS